MADKKNNIFITIDSINIKGKYFEINGTYPEKNAKIYYKISEENLIELDVFKRNRNDGLEVTSFSLKVSQGIQNIMFYVSIEGKICDCCLKHGNFSKLNNYKCSYFIHDNLLVYSFDNKIVIQEKKCILLKEIKYIFCLLIHKHLRAFILRSLYWISRPFYKNKKIWIVCDKFDRADDNGEHFFKYVNKSGDRNISYYYAISKESPHVDRVKKIGKVVYFRTLKYYLLYLNSENVISSQIGPFIRNPLGRSEKYFNGIKNSNFIFLQHGIIKEDLSSWLGKFNKNISMFVTSTTKEYKSILETNNYHYDESVVKLTGLPRFDNLIGNVPLENKIIFMPTWREKYANPIDHKTETREYFKEFKNSDYFKFFNKLINDKRLVEALKKSGYTAKFFLHPCHNVQFEDFKQNEYCKVNKNPDYQYEFSSAKLMITDFSSVTFDFAYLNKPIIYAQFDIKDMKTGHTYVPGSTKYYSYEKDGFGPILYNYEDTLEKIINYIKNDCKIETKYINRINKIYKYHDNNNCKRVYNEIKKLNGVK